MIRSSSMPNGTALVIDFIQNTTWNDLPADVQHQARRCLLDLLGSLIAGTMTPVGQLMAGFASDQWAGGPATIAANGQRVSPVGAAMANGFAINALDIDDGYRPIKGHPGACILPPLLAAAETVGTVSGKEFLTALVIGYEVGIRAGLIRHATYSTYHSSGSWGAIAGAAVAGRLLGLEPAALRQALGTAEYHAPIAPMMKGIETPCMGKDSIGWGCMVAMASTLMAQRGFTGIEPLFSDSPNIDWITSLGKRYEMLNLYFKPFACCRWAQPAIAGASYLASQYHLTADDITTIRVHSFSSAKALSRVHPQNTEEAQYNLCYSVAAALIDGELGPRQVLPPRIFDQATLALADRVEIIVKPDYDAEFPAKAYSDVEIVTRAGQTLRSGRMEAPWQPPDSSPADEELERKFRWLVEPVLGRRRVKQIIKKVWRCDEIDNAESLIRDCIVPAQPH